MACSRGPCSLAVRRNFSSWTPSMYEMRVRTWRARDFTTCVGSAITVAAACIEFSLVWPSSGAALRRDPGRPSLPDFGLALFALALCHGPRLAKRKFSLEVDLHQFTVLVL